MFCCRYTHSWCRQLRWGAEVE